MENVAPTRKCDIMFIT